MPAQAAPPAGAVDTSAAPAEPAVAAAPEIPEAPKSLLEQFDATEKAKREAIKEAAKPVEPAKEAAKDPAKPEGEKKVEGEPAAERPPLEPINYEYTLPDAIKMDEAQRADVHKAFDAFRADPAKGVQGLVDLHNKVMTEFATDLAAKTRIDQYKTFNETRKDWQGKVMADEELGGSGYETVIRSVARMRDRFTAEKHRGELEEFGRVTGAFDHPAFIRLMRNVARAFDEPSLPPPNAKPTPDTHRAPPRSKTEILYRTPDSRV